jgi:co-chaperonin GroES (HSP10)
MNSLDSLIDASFKQMEAKEVSAFSDRETCQELPIDGGFEPANNKVVVLPDPIMRESAGGIALPDELIFKEEMAQIFATLVAVGPDAWGDKRAAAAEVGDRVMIAKFTGQLFTGPDNRRYRVIHDMDIIGKITREGVRK